MNFFIIWLLHHVFIAGVLLLRRSKQLHAFTEEGTATPPYRILKPIGLFLASSTLVYYFLFKLLLGWHFHNWFTEAWYVLVAFTVCDVLAFAMVYNTSDGVHLTTGDKLIMTVRRKYIVVRFLFFCTFYLRIMFAFLGMAIILGIGLVFILFPYERGKDTKLIGNYYLDYSGYGLANRTYITKRFGPFSKDIQTFANEFERKSAPYRRGQNSYPDPFPYRLEHGKDTVYVYAPNSVMEYENYVAVRAQPREYIKAYRDKANRNIVVEYWSMSALQQNVVLPE